MTQVPVINYQQIAERVPPGDRWTLFIDDERKIHDSIVEVLSAYMRATGYKGDYKLSPLSGALYIIEEGVAPEPKKEIKKYDIYGEV